MSMRLSLHKLHVLAGGFDTCKPCHWRFFAGVPGPECARLPLNSGVARERSLAPMYYRNAAAAIVVYDVTKAVSRDWYTQHGLADEL